MLMWFDCPTVGDSTTMKLTNAHWPWNLVNIGRVDGKNAGLASSALPTPALMANLVSG